MLILLRPLFALLILSLALMQLYGQSRVWLESQHLLTNVASVKLQHTALISPHWHPAPSHLHALGERFASINRRHAWDLINQALQLQPSDARLWSRVATLGLYFGHHESGLKAAAQALSMAPNTNYISLEQALLSTHFNHIAPPAIQTAWQQARSQASLHTPVLLYSQLLATDAQDAFCLFEDKTVRTKYWCDNLVALRARCQSPRANRGKLKRSCHNHGFL